LLSSTDNAKRLYPYRWKTWGTEADEAFVRQVAEDLAKEADPLPLLRLLSFFGERAYPGDPSIFLKQMQSDDEKIARAARMALRNVTHPKARQIAIELMTVSEWPDDGLDMLSNNYQNGDDKLVISALTRELSDDQFHALNISVRPFYKAHPSPATEEALMILYERLRCTICRESAVEMLLELGPLPDWMIEECRYDAYLETRKLVAG